MIKHLFLYNLTLDTSTRMDSFTRRQMEAQFLKDWAESKTPPLAYSDWLMENGFLLESRVIKKGNTPDWLSGMTQRMDSDKGKEEILAFFCRPLPEEEHPLVKNFFDRLSDHLSSMSFLHALRTLVSLIEWGDYKPFTVETSFEYYYEVRVRDTGVYSSILTLQMASSYCCRVEWYSVLDSETLSPVLDSTYVVSRFMEDPDVSLTLTTGSCCSGLWPKAWPSQGEETDDD